MEHPEAGVKDEMKDRADGSKSLLIFTRISQRPATSSYSDGETKRRREVKALACK